MTIDATLVPPAPPAPARDSYWFIGFDDGKVGQTWLEHERMLQAEAEREKETEIAACEQRLERAKADGEIAKDAFNREQKTFEELTAQARDARDDSDKNPTQYSRPMSAIFIVFALAILAADFPLSLAISTEILHSDTGADPWFVAAGIVAMGLFFKIIADPFMKPRYLLHPVLRPFTWGVTAILGLVIAIGLATVLGLLGIFRGGTVARPTQSVDQTYVSPSTPSTPAPTHAPGAVGSLQRALAELEMGFIAKVAFLALGLVLPILGGIFLATGTTRWHNYEKLKRLEARYAARQSGYETVVHQVHEQAALVRAAEHELESMKKLATLGSNRYHSYLHGYERGLCEAAAVDGHIADAVLGFVKRWLTIARQQENLLRTERIARANADRGPTQVAEQL